MNEYLFSEGKIQSKSGRCWGIIERNKARIRSELIRLKIRRKVSTIEGLASEEYVKSQGKDRIKSKNELLTLNKLSFWLVFTPRYVRVNTLLLEVEECKKKIKTFLEESDMSSHEYINITKEGNAPKTFCVDSNIPELLLFPPNTDFHDNELYTGGKIILQVR